ncbi:unnamed protein product [Larinioides sclopetarius]|uniref:MATH domain-containing protein n=1 Tax=Larinioides sclopetarius TaxID=280406 RepID=A0AAV2BYF3_9ARAC
MDRGKKEATILWYIENYSFCKQEKEEALLGPYFETEELEGTAWCLLFFPRGSTKAEKGFISLYIYREDDNGPEYVSTKFELSILAEDGSVLSSKEYDRSFERWQMKGSDDFLKIDESFCLRNLPRDILTVRCKMWRGEGEVHRVAPICVRTRIGVETISFRHEVDNFSALKPNQKHTIRIPSHLQKDCFVTSSLYFTVDSCLDGEMMVQITPPADSYILCKRRISLLQLGYEIWCRKDDNRFDVERKDIQELPLSLTRQEILNKEIEYLQNDKLILLCECSFSTGYVYENTEEAEKQCTSSMRDERK